MAHVAAGELTTSEAADMLGVSRSTVARWAKARGIDVRAARANLLVRLAADAAKFAPLFDMVYGDRCADR
jgi:excisionase family DNA binding protein